MLWFGILISKSRSPNLTGPIVFNKPINLDLSFLCLPLFLLFSRSPPPPSPVPRGENKFSKSFIINFKLTTGGLVSVSLNLIYRSSHVVFEIKKS